MASRTFHNVQALDHQRVEIVGSFSTNGSSTPTATKGAGFTVARTGTGTYTVTLTSPYVDVIAASADLSLATPTKQQAQVSGWTSPTTQGSRAVVTITTMATDTGTAADIAAATGNAVSFRITCLNSGAKPT
jgi:DNA-binding MurR/RpiR family transcriptional regulator